MTVVLRAATAADQPLITHLVRAARLNPLRIAWPNFLIAEETDGAARRTVGRTVGRVVGIGQLRPHGGGTRHTSNSGTRHTSLYGTNDGIVELASLVVVPEARGKGVGTMLVNALIAKADRPLYLMCDSGKVPYYQRFGFFEVTSRAAIPRSLRLVHAIGATLSTLLAVFRKQPPRVAIMAHPGAPKSHAG